MSDITELTSVVKKFRDDRDWKQFHNPKDMAISLLLESSEFLEHFQWKNKDEMELHLKKGRTELSDELADVFYWILLIASDLDIDLSEALKAKLNKSSLKYPVEKARGNHIKYTEL